MVKLFRSYLFWTYERGSFHYDVMVTLILLFLFISPHVINFRERPTPPLALQTREVLVQSAGNTPDGPQLRYEIRAEDLRAATTDEQRRTAILRIIAPIAGDVTLLRTEPVYDAAGKLVAWNAWAVR